MKKIIFLLIIIINLMFAACDNFSDNLDCFVKDDCDSGFFCDASTGRCLKGTNENQENDKDLTDQIEIEEIEEKDEIEEIESETELAPDIENDGYLENTNIADLDDPENSNNDFDSETESPDSESSQLKPYPKGVYTFVAYDSKIPSATLENKSLTGVLVHDKWYASEIKDQEFVFSDIETRISEASEADLTVVLGIGGSLYKSPEWLKETPGVKRIPILNLNKYQKDTYCKVSSVPVYWDPIFHAQKLEYIKAMGEHFKDRKEIVAVVVNFANFMTDDWNIQSKVKETECKDSNGNFIKVDQVQDLLDAGYTPDKMLEIGKEILSTAAEAFPNNFIKLPIGPQAAELGNGSKTFLAEKIVEWGKENLPNRLIIEIHNVNTAHVKYEDLSEDDLKQPYNQLYKMVGDAAPYNAMQMVSAAVNLQKDGCRLNSKQSPCEKLGTYQKAIDIALSYKANRIEIWAGDGRDHELNSINIKAKEAMEN